MRRMLQLGALFLILTALLTPISEALDRWDAPGLGNDTEMMVFALVFSLCLVLLVAKLTALLRQGMVLLAYGGGLPRSGDSETGLMYGVGGWRAPESSPPPLRI